MFPQSQLVAQRRQRILQLAITNDDQGPGRSSHRLTVRRIGANEACQILFLLKPCTGHEESGRQGQRRSQILLQASRAIRPGAEMLIVDSVVAREHLVTRHTESGNIVVMRRPADQAGRAQADNAPFDCLLPSMARVIMGRALGH